MGKQKSLLIFYAILCQGVASLSTNYTYARQSSVLLRKKRLIDRTLNGNRPVPLRQFPYIVNVQEDGVHICAGGILSEFIIITAAHCAQGNIDRYTVRSGSRNINRGLIHSVQRILRYPLARQFSFKNDFALLTIHPPINFTHSPNEPITLFEGYIPPNTIASTAGWGLAIKRDIWMCFKRRPVIGFPKELRSIDVPTVSTDQCRHAHGEDPEITNEVICTFDASRQKRCDTGDGGNPLVLHNQLIGILAWNPIAHDGPDIFVSLFLPVYRNWILENLLHPHSPLHPVSPHALFNVSTTHSSQNSRNSPNSHSSFSPQSARQSPHQHFHPQPLLHVIVQH